jgi:hypothetical protein
MEENKKLHRQYDHDRYYAGLDKMAFSVASSFGDADRDDAQYWWTQPAEVRLRHLERLRQLNYGHRTTARLQRVLEVVQRS